jgi:hypothetical protein
VAVCSVRAVERQACRVVLLQGVVAHEGRPERVAEDDGQPGVVRTRDQRRHDGDGEPHAGEPQGRPNRSHSGGQQYEAQPGGQPGGDHAGGLRQDGQAWRAAERDQVQGVRRRIRPYEVPISYRARSREEGKKITWRDGVEALLILARERMRKAPEVVRPTP